MNYDQLLNYFEILKVKINNNSFNDRQERIDNEMRIKKILIDLKDYLNEELE